MRNPFRPIWTPLPSIFKNFIWLLMSLLLIVAGLFVGNTSTETEASHTVESNDYVIDDAVIENSSMSAVIYGEGFDDVVYLSVETLFNDTGKVILNFRLFESESRPQTIWVLVCIIPPANLDDCSLDFTWNLSGNVKALDSPEQKDNSRQSYLTEATEGSSFLFKYFRVVVDDDEKTESIHIQLGSTPAVFENGKLIKIRTPYVCSYSHNKELMKMYGSNIEEYVDRFGSDNLKLFFSSGEINGKLLSLSHIITMGSYIPNRFCDNDSYELTKILPMDYVKKPRCITWTSKHDLFSPIIEYQSRKSGAFFSIITFLLTSTGSFLVPIFSCKIYEDLAARYNKKHKQRGKQKRRRKKRK